MSWLLLLVTVGAGVAYPPAFLGDVVDDYFGTPVPELESVHALS